MARTRFLPVFALALVALPGWSQAAPSQDDQTLNDLLTLLNTPITSASKRAERAIEAPSVVSVVMRDQILSHGWNSLNEVLYSLPGFGPSRDYDRRTVSSRGLFEGWNNNHILHLVDGIPFNDNIYGTAYTWEISPLFMARAVEVVRGPGSALYGSNATNGVVQVKTLSAKDLLGSGEALIRLGQRGERALDAVTGKVGDRASVVAGFSVFRTSGDPYPSYDGSLRRDAAGGLARFQVGDARDDSYVWAKAEGEGAFKGWTLQYHQQAWSYGTGHGWLWQIPDRPEQLREKRDILAAGYSGQLGAAWSQEYLLRVQRHELQWNVRFYPSNPAVYPVGMYEYLDTSAMDTFGRAQWSVDLAQGSNLLFGLEATTFAYSGDKGHTSNVDMTTFQATPNNEMLPLGPWLEYLKDKPFLNTGLYAQFSSGQLLGDAFKAVLGLRSDRTAFDYARISLPGKPTTSKTYSQASPRVALIWMPSKDLALKAMWGRAFRSPAPSELAGANTFTLASNIENLKPETLDTMELAVDWIVNPRMNWRTNVYRTKFKDQIAYSATNFNLSTNIYSLTTQGLETELLFGLGSWRGFVNYSYAKRVDEESRDAFVAPSPDRLTWEPQHRFKAGVIGEWGPWMTTFSLLHQGAVERRTTDVGLQTVPLSGGDLNVDLYRPRSLDAWTTLDAKVSYAVSGALTLSLMATNALDSDKNQLVKIQAFPFDYRGERRKVAFLARLVF